MKQNDFYEVDGCTDFIPVKLVKEHKHIMNTLELEVAESGFRTFAPNIYKFPKVNEPQKPVIPKFVLDWVDNSREYSFDFDEWLDYENQPSKVYDWLNPENKRQAELNTLALVTLIVNGPNAVEIKQEKLYTVKVLDSTLFKMTSDNHVRYKLIGENAIPSESKIGNYTFEVNLTEKEIKEADERLWQFAEEVE
ncbi:DUF1642 domain-containing protein [Streptococcus thermophilus]|uniref:DUF1642 domain-containing protein n=1 Tax=Streptococcus thermophilus M17PTZA496 TaxID=1433289 RepID=A0A0E2Q2R1_STRTR|nr:DUF1642 domain-containing protein [Streptococcus thermophilus]ETW90635.1 hypothetical protein X841_03650 [Streptococcus thermophilus M17PTZA496]